LRDAYVLLSGGGTPLTNNYSQYLQAQAMAAFFAKECPPDATWIFFGIGNRDDAPPLLGDVRREVKRDARLVQSWLPGTLPRNRPATRASFLRALREEILPAIRGGGTLHLFVGDHGELAGPAGKPESAITLWQLKPQGRNGWTTDDNEVLGVAELRQVLHEGLGEGRVVFCMTQCHSGGFHELGIAREAMAPREWFTSAPPAWWSAPTANLRLRAAGVTATDEASLAAGCDADPDPERWAGYERFLPESLLGIDLMTGQRKGAGARSFVAAHEQATLVDQTIDKPRLTSEHYLASWAQLIETKLAREQNLTPAVRAAVDTFRRSVDQGATGLESEALRQRSAQFARFTAQLAADLPSAAPLLVRGTRAELEAAIRARGGRGGGGRGGRGGNVADLRRAWGDELRPAWKAAVLAGKVPELSGSTLRFEKRLLELEDRGRNFLFTRGGESGGLLNELYWASGYAEPRKLDPRQAEAVARWAVERRDRIVAWGKTSNLPAVRAAAEKIGPGAPAAAEPPRGLSSRTAAERVLFYRRVLAAWEFLTALHVEPALSELQQLLDLERTPLLPGES
jgi:hypothetical protein